MEQFQLTVLGCSGGPFEAPTSSYLVCSPGGLFGAEREPHGTILAIDAGSGLASLSQQSTFLEASRIINDIDAYLITHPHLDHISSLVVNTPGYTRPKKVYGLKNTINALKNNLFNDIVWPDMVHEGLVQLTELQQNEVFRLGLYTIKIYPLSHGPNYLSSAYRITNQVGYSMMIFGDVESDKSSGKNYNCQLWKDIKHEIVSKKLNTILIECSTTDRPPPLFGHMTPTTLFDELLVLNEMLVASGDNIQPLKDFNIFIIHVKECAGDPKSEILAKLQELNQLHNLGINFQMAQSGQTYCL